MFTKKPKQKPDPNPVAHPRISDADIEAELRRGGITADRLIQSALREVRAVLNEYDASWARPENHGSDLGWIWDLAVMNKILLRQIVLNTAPSHPSHMSDPSYAR